MPCSQSSECELARVLQERFAAGKPTLEAFLARLLSHFQQQPKELRGRKNRTLHSHSLKKATLRWLKGKIPQRNSWPAIAIALDEPEEYVEKLCTSSQQVPSIYRFASTPFAVIAAWDLGDGSLTAHQDDRRAFEILKPEIDKAVGITLETPLLARGSSAPGSYTDHDLILISGPNGNPLATQLNSFVADSELSAFYFASVPDLSRPDWVIAHTKIGLRIILPREQSRTSNEDYGVLYVGKNPEAAEHYLIWLAGLHSRGTVGAATALLMPEVRTRILEEFSRGRQYISAIVRFDCSKDTRGIVHVLYA